MAIKLVIVVFAALIGVSYGFGIKEIWDYLVGAGVGYGQYPYPQYPGGHYPGAGGHYPGNQYPGGQYPGSGQHYYPGSNYVEGPPGAHPGCPLCDSSVYDYCSYKQEHDSCCCENNSFLPNFNCRKANCKFLYANSCEENRLISNCCCIDVRKNAIAAPVVAVAPVVV